MNATSADYCRISAREVVFLALFRGRRYECVATSTPPPHDKIVSASVISTRSISARSKMNSIAETKNNANRGISFTRTIVVTKLKSPISAAS
jgi:hypothetical protein